MTARAGRSEQAVRMALPAAFCAIALFMACERALTDERIADGAGEGNQHGGGDPVLAEPWGRIVLQATDSGVTVPLKDGAAILVPMDLKLRWRYEFPVDLSFQVQAISWEGAPFEHGANTSSEIASQLVEPGSYPIQVVVSGRASRGHNAAEEHRFAITLTVSPVATVSVCGVIDYPGVEATPPVDRDGDLRVDSRDLAQFWDAYGRTSGQGRYFQPLTDWDLLNLESNGINPVAVDVAKVQRRTTLSPILTPEVLCAFQLLEPC